jgi:hypothetical protein
MDDLPILDSSGLAKPAENERRRAASGPIGSRLRFRAYGSGVNIFRLGR